MTLQKLTPQISAGVDGGRAEGLACAYLGARTHIGATENFDINIFLLYIFILKCIARQRISILDIGLSVS